MISKVTNECLGGSISDAVVANCLHFLAAVDAAEIMKFIRRKGEKTIFDLYFLI
jgi:hypothetical protein